MEKPREGEKLNTDYNQLLKQIQNLSELQSNGTIQNADPNFQVKSDKIRFCSTDIFFQAAYVARLQQQAAQIKHLLKLLNTSGVNPSLNGSSCGTETPENASGYQSHFAQDETNPDNGGYESLWELSGRTLTNFPEVEATTEVEEEEDILGDQEDLYENTGVSAHNFTISVGMFHYLFGYADILHRFSNNAFEMRN